MKNIKSSKGQDGFIGEILGFIVGAVILYIVIVTLMFVVGFTFVAKEGKETREYRATFTDTEWVVKEAYEFAMRSCTRYPDRKYANFNCNWSEAQWATTPLAKKAIIKQLARQAEVKWIEENTTYYVEDNGLGYMATKKKYPSRAEFPCTYTYLNNTYNC